eukprot:CAMPEP_0202029960 /NCGR_PEP_ID=MMETSP0905-20130828/64250_1 /ASSEMBLY_ACC=CAM_ASM_000554 /TAXON_ID=420261 /ORGANISM="Thalassiosira antarctica, Strain CCMP982" /LENGTH=639 /DNA_ID=CAMNT_0048593743 /DNA_START=37 /DNA_END=1953 /DNA_ORIENTATION=+
MSSIQNKVDIEEGRTASTPSSPSNTTAAATMPGFELTGASTGSENEDDLELLEEGLATTSPLPPATPEAAVGSRSMASSTPTDPSPVANSSRSNATADDALEQPPSDGAGLELMDNDDGPPLRIDMVVALLNAMPGFELTGAWTGSENEDDLELLEEGLATTSPPATPDAAVGLRSMVSSARTNPSPVANSSRSNATADDALEQPPSDGAGLELMDNDDGPPLPIDMVVASLNAADSTDEPLPNRNNNNTPPPAAATAPSLGPELTDDRDGPPLPIGIAEAILNAAESSEEQQSDRTAKRLRRVEHDEDNVGPGPPAVMLEGSNFKKMAASSAKVESVDDDNAPAPFNSALDQVQAAINATSPPTPFNFDYAAEFENDDDNAMEKKKKPATMPSNEESPIIPTRGEIEDENEYVTNRSNYAGRRGGAEELLSSNTDEVNNNNSRQDTRPVDTDLRVEEEENNVEDANPSSNPTIQADAAVRPATERGPSMPLIPEAFLVTEREDEEVFIATHFIAPIVEPTLPWHKQPWARILLAIMFIIAAALAITLGVVFSSNDQPTVVESVTVIASSDAPSVSIAPSSSPSNYPTVTSSTVPSTTNFPSSIPTTTPSISVKPTTSPSFEPSPSPSSSPSACVGKIS